MMPQTTFNRVMDPTQYAGLATYLALYDDLASRFPHAEDHQHRRWEYGLILSALKAVESPIKSILEIGGGGSIFGSMAMNLGYHVTVMDPHYRTILSVLQADYRRYAPTVIFDDFMTAAPIGLYDAVVALSVIEHVEYDEAFYRKMSQVALKFIAITTDFDPEGRQLSSDHLRTYTPAALKKLALVGERTGFSGMGDYVWEENGKHVNGYNFASLCQCRSGA